jgi:hypothetical protein
VRPADSPALGAFLFTFQHSAVLESYLQLMAEDKLRRDAQVQTLTNSAQSLERQLKVQTEALQQAKDASECQQTVLRAYRHAAEDAEVSDGVLVALFRQAQQAVEAGHGPKALVLCREIAAHSEPEFSEFAHQCRAWCIFGIGFVLATQMGDRAGARRALLDFLGQYEADTSPMVRDLLKHARSVLTELQLTTPTA